MEEPQSSSFTLILKLIWVMCINHYYVLIFYKFKWGIGGSWAVLLLNHHPTPTDHSSYSSVIAVLSPPPPGPPPGDSLSSISFTGIMAGVTFALSGFKNPLRGQLRDKALAMGAKYEPDWGPHCSHLVWVVGWASHGHVMVMWQSNDSWNAYLHYC